MRNSAFTLVEMMMTVVIVSFMFVAVNSMLVMTMRRQLINSFSESEEQKCQRAALEINGYIRSADTVQVLDPSGVALATGGANWLRTQDASGATTAEFEFIPGVGSSPGSLLIRPQGLGSGFTYSEKILPPDSGNVFTWGLSGFTEYSYILSLDSGSVPYTGVAKPNP